MQPGDDLIVIIRRRQIIGAAKHALVEAGPRVMIAERPDHRDVQRRLGKDALQLGVAAKVAPVGQVSAGDDEIGRRLQPFHIL